MLKCHLYYILIAYIDLGLFLEFLFPSLGVSSGTSHTVLITVILYNVLSCGGISTLPSFFFFKRNFLVIVSQLFF